MSSFWVPCSAARRALARAWTSARPASSWWSSAAARTATSPGALCHPSRFETRLDHRRQHREVRGGRRSRAPRRRRRAAPAPSTSRWRMPPSAVITKKIILPAGLPEEELEVQVESEANQYIPFSLDEVSLDFCVIGPSPTSPGDVEVLIAASRKEKVAGPPGPGRSRRPEAGRAWTSSRTPRALAVGRLIGDAAQRGPRPDRGAVRDRRRHHQHAGAAQRRDALRPRPGLRRRAAHPADRRASTASRPKRRSSKKRSGDLPDDYETGVLRALRRQHGAGSRARAAVLLHQHAAHTASTT